MNIYSPQFPGIPGAALGGRPIRKPSNISELTHPDHLFMSTMWYKWRLCYESGLLFKNIYMKMYSAREDANEFLLRREMSYIPAFAKSGINEVRNMIAQRLHGITRTTTSDSYNECMEGCNGGVDRRGSSMEMFLTNEIIVELLVMGKVGIYVDSPNTQPAHYGEAIKLKPYIYPYKAEQIRSWSQDDRGQLLTLVLEDVDYAYDDTFLVPTSTIKRYRFYWIDEQGYVNVQFYDDSGQMMSDGALKLNIKQIPFHILKLSDSLMKEICDYQIALMNLASSDIQFTRMAGFPMYAEMYDINAELAMQGMQGSNNNDHPELDGSMVQQQHSGVIEKYGGITRGRRIPKGLEYPKWISPPTECLDASMKKQEQMKAEMRTLLYLSLGNLQPVRASADAKSSDLSDEETGLSYIGNELRLAECRICEFWLAYENNPDPYTIIYPTNYDVKTTEQRVAEATSYIKLLEAVPVLSYKKELLKLIVKALFNNRIDYDALQAIYDDIDKLKVVVGVEELIIDIENRLVSHELASDLRGYPKGETDKADKEAIDHATAIIEAQTPPGQIGPSGAISNPAARGLPELSSNPKQDVINDRNKNQKYTPRGDGKKPSSKKLEE